MLLLLFMIGFGYAEKSVLIIGGDDENRGATAITVEQFFPSSMSSELIGEIEFHPNDDNPQQWSWVQATPVNATHAFLLPRNNSHSYYIDTAGKLTPGPKVLATVGPGLTSIPGENGQMIPIYCGGRVKVGDDWEASRSCKLISSGQQNFESMLEERWWPSLTAFEKTLIVIGRDRHATATIERYDGKEWKACKPAPAYFQSHTNAAVKLSETALLTCGGQGNLEHCYVYHVDRDDWTQVSNINRSGFDAKMVLIDQTVYAFGGSHGGRSNVQTLDISGGIEKAQWKLEHLKLKKPRAHFGVWVIDSTPRSTATGYTFSIIFLLLFLSIVSYFVLGVLYRRFVVGARGIQLLPNHDFWLKIYDRTHSFCAAKFAAPPLFVSTIANDIQNYNRFVDEVNVTPPAAPTQQAVVK